MVPGGLPTERQTQRAILAMCGVSFPRVFVTHVPNGAHLAGDAGARFRQIGALKGDGLKIGFYDLLLLWPTGWGASLEVKRAKTGKVSPAQAVMAETYERLGWPAAVVTSVDEAYMKLREWGAPWSGHDPRMVKLVDAYHPEVRS